MGEFILYCSKSGLRVVLTCATCLLTSAPTPQVPHGTYRDPELFVTKLGMTPMESILAATAKMGELMLQPTLLGKVQPGFFADLILVDGNPLEDISLLSHHENLDVIMIVSYCTSLGCVTSGCRSRLTCALAHLATCTERPDSQESRQRPPGLLREQGQHG